MSKDASTKSALVHPWNSFLIILLHVHPEFTISNYFLKYNMYDPSAVENAVRYCELFSTMIYQNPFLRSVLAKSLSFLRLNMISSGLPHRFSFKLGHKIDPSKVYTKSICSFLFL